MFTSPLDRLVKLIEQHFRSLRAALLIPRYGRLGLLQSRGVNSYSSPHESGSEPAAGVLPGDELNSPAVNLLKTQINLLPPGFFRALVDCMIKALNQRID